MSLPAAPAAHWQLRPRYDTPALRAAFGSLDAVFAATGEKITRDPLSEVIRVTVDGVRYYVKRYHGAAKNPLRNWFGRPRVQAEWENLLAFQAWGIRTAEVVGHGLERRLGAFQRGALITEEICHSVDLAQLARHFDPRLHQRAWLAPLLRQVAHAARTLHAHGFTHNDFKWRNLLVDDATPPTLYLIDCPAGETWRGPFLARRIVKDLACLDKVARYVLTRSWRLRFYLAYSRGDVGSAADHGAERTLKPRRLTATDKALLRQVLGYFEGRE